MYGSGPRAVEYPLAPRANGVRRPLRWRKDSFPAAATMNVPSLSGPARSTTAATCRNCTQRARGAGPAACEALAGAKVASAIEPRTRLTTTLTMVRGLATLESHIARFPSVLRFEQVAVAGSTTPVANRDARSCSSTAEQALSSAVSASDFLCEGRGRSDRFSKAPLATVIR